MATVTHAFVSAVTDDLVAGEIGPTDWNDAHTLVGVDPHSAYVGSLTLADGAFMLQLARLVSASSERLTLEGTARVVDFGATDTVVPNLVGVPKRPKYPIRIPDGFEHRITGRYALENLIRLSIEGDGELDCFEDLGTSRVVMTGRG